MEAHSPAAASPVVELFLQLAAIASPSFAERPALEHVAAFLRDLGLEPVEDDIGPRVGSNCGNLLCHVPATPGALERGGIPIFLCAHLDTVPPAPGAELRPVLEDGVVRNAGGTILGADDKAAVAVMLDAVRRVVGERREHAGIDLLFTLQEEISLAGAREVDLSRLAARVGFVYDQAAPIGEVILAAPHQTGVDLVFHGRSAHAGMFPELGRSAIMAAAKAIAALPHGRIDAETTCNVGVIEGGTALNVVAERCAVRVDVRCHDEAGLARLIQDVLDTAAWAANEAECTLEAKVYETCPGYRLTAADPAVRLATAALARAGYAPSHTVTGGGADTNALNRRGCNAVTLSNGMADIHTPAEHIAVADLEGMVEVTLALVDVAREGGG